MGLIFGTSSVVVLILLFSGFFVSYAHDEEACGEVSSAAFAPKGDVTPDDKKLLAFPLNLEYLETEFFAYGALGYGLDKLDPGLAENGPAPKGAQKAKLDILVRDIIAQFALQEVGHLKAIKGVVKEEGFPRPLLDLSVENWNTIMEKALGIKLDPPFSPYENSLNYMLASYAIPYVGLTGYVGANPLTQSSDGKRLLAGLLGVESGQDAVIRTYLYERKDTVVEPYKLTVHEITSKLSLLRSNLDDATGIDDEGLVVPKCLGAEQKIEGNILVGDKFSLSFARTPQQVLEIVYGTGDARKPGGFYPDGASGAIATKLRKAANVYF
ncbi:hypothetical protein SELMODRAFT_143620 [Selaginella moellendorffii]|uniref:Desiccation-related protein PCC13-62 n=1 Tax=Selaginella moellendorffii TaxID=88036 RepID=D8R4F9_SELML|nr:desiccation-related protein PCC13-62 [Selaginella moellendorffii]XP_002971661.1 desiccation-related protein PCC13-62 [Selaginella moellendorffii]EFJ27410.1 hypothetical protein SELMODRAFT_270912 [Selaginella moellendorffii]EFJ33097.1 hypothetical protein SELMODRAFT_143620 [Selaginella moellendorffii]|eukprot:XP_002965677.1 desiccation-related protein PCC13-62 [Selaginella moellendorffii]